METVVAGDTQIAQNGVYKNRPFICSLLDPSKCDSLTKDPFKIYAGLSNHVVVHKWCW